MYVTEGVCDRYGKWIGYKRSRGAGYIFGVSATRRLRHDIEQDKAFQCSADVSENCHILASLPDEDAENLTNVAAHPIHQHSSDHM